MVDLSEFLSLQIELLRRVPGKYKRFLFSRINWDNRLIGVVGGRGAGKSTLLLQYLAERQKAGRQCMYISADHIRVEAIGLYELASSFFRTGGEILAIDEIHKYANWGQEIKNIYDLFPDSMILFSGSSSLHLQLGKTDLSRRAVYYSLPVLSFREYLLLCCDVENRDCTLEEIFREHGGIAAAIRTSKPILGHFKDYLSHGAYPFILEGEAEYHAKLRNVIEKVLYEDIPATTGIRFSGVPVLKKIINEIVTSPPYELNIDRLANNIGVSRQTIYTYLDHLERAGLLIRVMPPGAGATLTRKPAKLYLNDTNLTRAIGQGIFAADIAGAARETFFAGQVTGAGFALRAARKGDFLVDGQYVCEIGGKSKKQRQIKGEHNGYIIKDDIEVGTGNVIPLWLFGFLY